MESNTNKLDREEACKAVFERYLELCKTFQKVEWKRYPKGQNLPPDYNLITEEKTFAVEITGLIRIKKSKDDQCEVGTYQVSRLKLADELTNDALALGILQGTYTINFVMDWLVELKKARNQIRRQVFDFLQNSKEKDTDRDSYIRYKLKTVGQISKHSIKGGRIYATFTDADWTDSPEILTSAFDMVQRTVSSKLAKLDKGNVPKPWVLLLYNTNPFVSEATFRKCEDRRSVEGKEAFDRIFIVTSPEAGFDFYIKGR